MIGLLRVFVWLASLGFLGCCNNWVDKCTLIVGKWIKVYRMFQSPITIYGDGKRGDRETELVGFSPAPNRPVPTSHRSTTQLALAGTLCREVEH